MKYKEIKINEFRLCVSVEIGYNCTIPMKPFLQKVQHQFDELLYGHGNKINKMNLFEEMN